MVLFLTIILVFKIFLYRFTRKYSKNRDSEALVRSWSVEKTDEIYRYNRINWAFS